jgi:3-oxoacyl-[acyl-carrier protein] reductase
MPFTLEGKAALVTGAGRGIGRAIAARLADAGAAVLINDLDEDAARESAAALPRAECFAGDVTAPEFPARLIARMLERFGAIDIIVNNAGYTWDNVIQKTSDEQFQTMLDVHVVAPFRILRAASAWIRETAKKESAEGRRTMRKVVNITSISGIGGYAGQSGYSSGKAAVTGLTRTLAKEWGRYNVNVNAVGFGLIETRLIQPGQQPVEIRGREIRLGMLPEALEEARQAIPLGRLGTPEEAAAAVLFFCSPLSDYVSGEVLICGGGFHF